MRKKVLGSIKTIELGDLVRVEWFDASIGKSLASGTEVDIPVKSWGIYIGLLGVKTKHIILAQNSFRYTEEVYDVDYTCIPLSWAVDIALIIKGEASPEVADRLLKSFLAGRCRKIKKRTKNHEMGQTVVNENCRR